MENISTEKLVNDIKEVIEWRKSGKVLTKEEQFFAERVADEMIAIRVLNKGGAQLILSKNVKFVKEYGGPQQDMVSSGQKAQPNQRVSAGLLDVAKVAKPVGEKPKEVPKSSPEKAESKRNSPMADKVKLTPPQNQAEGEVSSVADIGAPDMVDAPSEDIGHNPELPMPKKQAEDLIANAEWGVEIGAYATVKEGIERQLGRKAYAEFVDTDEKLKSVNDYLTQLQKEAEPKEVANG